MELKEINRLLNKEKGKGKIFSLSENTDDQQNNLAGLCFQKRIVLSKKKKNGLSNSERGAEGPWGWFYELMVRCCALKCLEV